MRRRQLLAASAAASTGIALAGPAIAQTGGEAQASFDTVMAVMGAMGGGDMDRLGALMAEDMVWQNEGDPDLPWIDTWEGKEAIFGFLGSFSQNVVVTHWENQDAFASGDKGARRPANILGLLREWWKERPTNQDTGVAGPERGHFPRLLRQAPVSPATGMIPAVESPLDDMTAAKRRKGKKGAS